MSTSEIEGAVIDADGYAEQTPRDRWLAERRAGIGGSDAAAIMGVSPWKSAYALWAEKTGLAPEDNEDTEYLEWGRRLEGAIAAKYAEVTGRRVRLNGAENMLVHRHPSLAFMLGTLDGDVEAGDRPDPGLLEVKTAGVFAGHDWDEGAPLHYQVQTQHYLAVTGRSWASFAVLIGGQRFKWYDVARNDDFIAALEAKCGEFWRRVEERDPPPVDDSESTGRALRALHPADNGETVDLGGEGIRLVEELEAAKAAIKEAEARKQGAENAIRALLGAATYGVVPGMGRFSLKTQRRAEHFVKASEFRVLRFSEKGL